LRVGLTEGNERRDIEGDLDMEGQVIGDMDAMEKNAKRRYDDGPVQEGGV
jgi:hypothetical protein